MVVHFRNSKQMNVAPESAWMTSQLRHNFRATQAVHGADDIAIPNFLSQVSCISQHLLPPS